MPAIPRLTPRQSVAAECERRGEAAVVAGCIELLHGRHDVDDALVLALGGPAARYVLDGHEGGKAGYWPRVWAARGLLYAWDERAAAAVIQATADEAWRVREMAAKVIGKHLVTDGRMAVAGLCDDQVERVRAAAERAGNSLAASGEARHPGPMTSLKERLSHGQVSLRRWRLDDAAALLAAVIESQEELRPWMPWADSYDADSAAGFLRDCERRWASGDAFAYAIIVGDQIVGSAGLHNRIGDDALEIGYWVHSDWTGRGIATDAAAALTLAALALPGVERVAIYHDAANAASGRVPAKLGYTRVGERPPRDLWPPAPGEAGIDVVWQITR